MKLSLSEQLKQLGYKEEQETKKETKQMSRSAQLREERKEEYKSKKAKQKEQLKKEAADRKKKLNAQPKDKMFKMLYDMDPNKMYQITAYVDDIGTDKHDEITGIVSINCLTIIVNGQKYVIDHTHIRGDKVKLNPTWKLGQKITICAKLARYSHGTKDKYELINM